MLSKMKTTLSTVLISLIAFSGCSNNDFETVPPHTSGSVVKGLVQNALVCEDSNGNFKCDSNESQVRTDRNGRYDFSFVSSAPLVTVMDASSFDTSLQRSYDLTLYAYPSDDLNRDFTVFSTLEVLAVRELNVSIEDANRIISEKFGINPLWSKRDYISTPDLNITEKNEIETASAYVLQLLYRTQDAINDANATHVTLEENSKEITQSLLEVILSDAVVSLVDLDTNATLVTEIVNQTIQNIPSDLLSDDANQSQAIKESAIVVNEENNSTLETTDVVVPVADPAATFKALFAVPLSDEEGNILNQTELKNFEIVNYESNIETNDRNLTLDFTLDTTLYSDITLPFENTLYGVQLTEDSAVAVGINTKLGDDRLTAGNYFVFYANGITEYWGLATKETLCAQGNEFIVASVNETNKNQIDCGE